MTELTAQVAAIVNDLSSAVPTHLLPPLATAKEVANLLGTTEASLAQDRYLNRGVPYTRVGRRIRYLRSDVLKFLADNRIGGDAA
ncbi:helix-turn-helix domain-containing protein [Mycobacterium simiae]|uniref:Helix-turn-helix domain-containing protein n=1 Tax=Mycobacterium simiae TaxID=1784 RepID=A0A5B1BN30_MYCSI|nr:helix-turn-helix domain-containing protein [Mycobacterium simiae]KAA1248803.1 helix-turn-helix domain-containing protein [Mycobacterium simiae]